LAIKQLNSIYFIKCEKKYLWLLIRIRRLNFSSRKLILDIWNLNLKININNKIKNNLNDETKIRIIKRLENGLNKLNKFEL